MSTWWTAVHWLHLVAMAFFVGGQLFLAAVVVPSMGAAQTRPAHMRRPQLHALEGLIFVGSLAIVWLGVTLAH